MTSCTTNSAEDWRVVYLASNKGWIKLWRKVNDDDFCKGDVRKLGFWVWCLMKAVTEEGDYPLGNRMVHLKPGQFIFGRRKAARETGISETMVSVYLNQLHELGHLYKHVHKHEYTIVEVLKWGYYQGQDQNHKHDHKHENLHELYTIKEGKKIYASSSYEEEARSKEEKRDLEDMSNPKDLYKDLLKGGGDGND